MATKTFLNKTELDEAQKRLRPPSSLPDGDEAKARIFPNFEFSAWLENKLKEKLETLPQWPDTLPIALGSWARNELCPRSDIDLLFCGNEEDVTAFSDVLHGQGQKLRYRVPEDRSDWTKGVEPFDILALLQARPLSPEASLQLQAQQKLIKQSGLRRQLLRAMQLERKHRADRYDSISNFLEPNLKYGPGGLRDLQQALMAYELFADKFVSQAPHVLEVLNYYKAFFLTVRQKLHLLGGGDILSAPEQLQLTQWFGYLTNQDFMREIQKGLSRVSFYADWIFEQVRSSKGHLELVEKRKLNSVGDLFRALEKDPGVLMQYRVRQAAEEVFARSGKTNRAGAEIGREVERFISPSAPDAWTVALFRSRLIDHCIPEIKLIIGHVQHDQYHRFSVDAHLLQALRELKRVYQKPKSAGRLQNEIKKLGKTDWRILTWSCLYHDIAKGRGGDHSHKGVEITRKDLTRFGIKRDLIDEVAWMVEAHLLISEAAFRRNPHAPSTWQSLTDQGVVGPRTSRLTIFTVVDIRATNPEAWTSWKERLLSELAQTLSAPETSHYLKFLKSAQVLKLNPEHDLLHKFDPFVVEAIRPTLLAGDLQAAITSVKGQKESLEPLLVQGKAKDLWIRFHSRQDRSGLFLEFVETLYRLGCSVRHASVQTDPLIGAYDWFHIKSNRTAAQLRKTLKHLTKSSVPPEFTVKFDAIELVSQDDQEIILSFRGRDQKGALVQAARAIFNEELTIQWAKVHTWGRQIDDVFGIKVSRDMNAQALLERIRSKLKA